jgi:hypothetical protein
VKVICPLLGGEVFTARLVASPSPFARGETQTVLELAGGAPIQLEPPDASGTEVVEATPAEWAALRAAGFDLPVSKRGAGA